MTRVVDISGGIAGAYCTKVLADLGYDVVKTQPVEDSALARFLARNKTVDASTELAAAAVLVTDGVENRPELSPEAVRVVITPFGLDTWRTASPFDRNSTPWKRLGRNPLCHCRAAMGWLWPYFPVDTMTTKPGRSSLSFPRP